MASTSQRPFLLLLALLILSIFAISASATRPCKTLFVSSYFFSLRGLPSTTSSGEVTVVTEISPLRPVRYDDGFAPHRPDSSRPAYQAQTATPLFPFIKSASSASYDLSSLRDRTKDILSVVVSLLFGLGCGALTAATMYLAWSVFVSRSDNDGSSASSFDDDFYGFNPKKMGYVKISEAVAADSSVPLPPSPVKEAATAAV